VVGDVDDAGIADACTHVDKVHPKSISSPVVNCENATDLVVPVRSTHWLLTRSITRTYFPSTKHRVLVQKREPHSYPYELDQVVNVVSVSAGEVAAMPAAADAASSSVGHGVHLLLLLCAIEPCWGAGR
jgi:hypothetical protein